MKILRVVQRIDEITGAVEVYSIPMGHIGLMKVSYVPMKEDDKKNDEKNVKTTQNNEGNFSGKLKIVLHSGHIEEMDLKLPTKFIIIATDGKVELETRDSESFSIGITQLFEELQFPYDYH